LKVFERKIVFLSSNSVKPTCIDLLRNWVAWLGEMYSGSGWRRFGLTGKPYGLLQILDFEIQDVLYKIRMYHTKSI
jgi:hypothetical protein